MCPREWSPTANGRYRAMRYGGIAATARQAVANAAATAGATNPTPCMCRAGAAGAWIDMLCRHLRPFTAPHASRNNRSTLFQLPSICPLARRLPIAPSTVDLRCACASPPQRRRCSAIAAFVAGPLHDVPASDSANMPRSLVRAERACHRALQHSDGYALLQPIPQSLEPACGFQCWRGCKPYHGITQNPSDRTVKFA